MGDVAAKDESQTSLAQLVGYSAGIGLLTLSHSPAYLYALFFLCTPAHLSATVAMMRIATFETLTLPRLTVLARDYAAADGSVGVPTFKEFEAERATGWFGEYFKSKADKYVTLAPRVGDVLGRDAERKSGLWEVCTDIFWVSRFQPTHPSVC